jgi:Na+-driven multidrug efflux pump
MVLTQSFNGAGDTWTPTWINVGCFWCWEIPLAGLLALYFGWGPTGVYVAVTIAFSTVAVVSAILFRRGRWKLKAV